MLISELTNALHELYAPESAEKWDYVGLLSGNPDTEIKAVSIGLDPSEDFIHYSHKMGANFLITHHPPTLKPDSLIRPDRIRSRFTYHTLSKGLAHLVIHTNFDHSKENGLEKIATRLKLTKTQRLSRSETSTNPKEGYGIIGNLENPSLFSDFAKSLFLVFPSKTLALYPTNSLKSGEKKVKCVAFVNGSGGSFFERARSAGADILITGDLTHHIISDSHSIGLGLIDPGHAPSEFFFNQHLSTQIEKIAKKAFSVFMHNQFQQRELLKNPEEVAL